MTYSVKVIVRDDKEKADGSWPLNFSLRVGSYVTKLSTGKSIDPRIWDKTKKCVKTTTTIGAAMDKYLTKKISGFYEYALECEAQGQVITTTIATAYFKGVKAVSLFDFWEQQIEMWGEDKEPNTLKSYRSALNIVKEFNPKLTFGDLSKPLILKFDYYMAKERGNTIGGRFTKHKCFKAILNSAVEYKLLKENPYRFFPIKSAEGTRIALTVDEVIALMKLKIPSTASHLHKVRDMFLFSCFTGLRYSDVVSICIKNLKLDDDQPRLEFTVKKTKRETIIPINTHARKIVDRYLSGTSKSTAKLFPPITNQVLNRELKQLFKLTDFDKVITFHCGRHTFACTHIEMGTSIMFLKELMDHRDVRHTQIYAKALKRDLYKSMNILDQHYNKRLSQ